MSVSTNALMVASALASHISGSYPVGAANDEWLNCYKPNLASILFVLSFAVLLTQQGLTPRTINPLPRRYEKLWNVLASIFVTSIVLRLIWLPLSLGVRNINRYLADMLRSMNLIKSAPLEKLIEILECTQVVHTQLLLLALLNLHITLHVTGYYDVFLHMIDNKFRSNRANLSHISCGDEEDEDEEDTEDCSEESSCTQAVRSASEYSDHED